MNYTLVFTLFIAVLLLIYYGNIYLSRFKLIGQNDPSNTDDTASAKGWQLYYFYSPNCGACKTITPIIEKHSEQHKQVSAIDISTDLEMAHKFNVRATPTVVFVENNIVSDVQLGSNALQPINNFIQRHGH